MTVLTDVIGATSGQWIQYRAVNCIADRGSFVANVGFQRSVPSAGFER